MTGKQNMSRKSCECECTGHSWLFSVELSMKSTTFLVKKKQKVQQKIHACQYSIRPGKVDLLFTLALHVLHLRPAASVIIAFQSCWQTPYTLGKSTTAIKSVCVIFRMQYDRLPSLASHTLLRGLVTLQLPMISVNYWVIAEEHNYWT